jgi:hypothetical protein
MVPQFHAGAIWSQDIEQNVITCTRATTMLTKKPTSREQVRHNQCEMLLSATYLVPVHQAAASAKA